MACVAKRLLCGSAAPVACALAALCAPSASAASDLKLFAPDTLEITGDVRVTAVDGERSWLDGGFGKLRSSGGGDDFQVRPQLGNVNLIWQPQFTWSLSATIVGSLQGGERTEAGLSQAYLTFRPCAEAGRLIGARRPDVPAGQPRARRRRLARQGFDHPVGDQQLVRRRGPPGRCSRARSPAMLGSTSFARRRRSSLRTTRREPC